MKDLPEQLEASASETLFEVQKDLKRIADDLSRIVLKRKPTSQDVSIDIIKQAVHVLGDGTHEITVRLDGDRWCALQGPDVMVGTAGFGDTPAEALDAFCREWLTQRGERDLAIEDAWRGVSVSPKGDRWQALYQQDDKTSPIIAFGDTPDEAVTAFCREYASDVGMTFVDRDDLSCIIDFFGVQAPQSSGSFLELAHSAAEFSKTRVTVSAGLVDQLKAAMNIVGTPDEIIRQARFQCLGSDQDRKKAAFLRLRQQVEAQTLTDAEVLEQCAEALEAFGGGKIITELTQLRNGVKKLCERYRVTNIDGEPITTSDAVAGLTVVLAQPTQGYELYTNIVNPQYEDAYRTLVDAIMEIKPKSFSIAEPEPNSLVSDALKVLGALNRLSAVAENHSPAIL